MLTNAAHISMENPNPEFDIPGFPHYTITLKDVKVRSKYTGKILVPQDDARPYVNLREMQTTWRMHIADLVVLARGDALGDGMVAFCMDGNNSNFDSSNVKVITLAERKKIAEARQKRKHATTPVCLVDKNLKVLKEFRSIREASEATGCKAPAIQSVCDPRGIVVSVNDMYWRYKTDLHRPIGAKVINVSVQQVDIKTGDILMIYKSVSMAASETKTDANEILEVCEGRGNGISAGGYGWHYTPKLTAGKTVPDYTKWKKIKGYSRYRVTPWGQIYSAARNVFIKRRVSKKGYYYVSIYNDMDVRKRPFVHCLVAKAYIRCVRGKPYVNHKDGKKLNDLVKNLEWCTTKENVNHAVAMGLRHGNAVIQYDKRCKELARFPSMAEAERKTGVKSSSIWQCCEKYKYHNTAGEYLWKYVDDPAPIKYIPPPYPQRVVIRYDAKTNKEIDRFDSLSKAYDASGYYREGIQASCNNLKPHNIRGYYWRWAD